MAASHAAAVLLLLLLAATAPSSLHAADDTTHLHFFMHDIVSGSNPTSVPVIKGPGGANPTAPSLGMTFGDTSVIDDALTETSASTSTPVGRMQGIYMLSSQSAPVLMVTANILLTSGDYNGSTLAVMGRDDTAADVRELAVVGGTGKFRMATGYVLWKTTAMNAPDATIELDVYLGTGNGTIDASAPVSPVDGGSGGSGSSGSGSKSSSGAARVTVGWVVAAVVAVVGSWIPGEAFLAFACAPSIVNEK
ncbi:hypothetical protein EJB05_13671, partial [Eragrostis curvula]